MDSVPHDLIPEIGTVPQALRAFRVNWAAALVRGADGEPILPVSFVSQNVRVLHIIDVRDPEELCGPLGYIPGSFAMSASVTETLDPDDPIIVVDGNNELAPVIAKALEARGHRLVAFMWGGMNEWRAFGLGVTRDASSVTGSITRIVPRYEATRRHLDIADIEAHVGDPRALTRQKLASLITHGKLSCVDGRDHGAVLGTPGGDGGELLLALSALERTTGSVLTDGDVARIVRARLDAFGHCAIHTDLATANRVIAAMRAHPRLAAFVEGISDTLDWRKFWTRPPKGAHDDLLELLVDPDHIGCGHLKLSLTAAEDYGTRASLVQAFLRAFFRERFAGSPETEYTPLPGGHAEGAVLRVRVPEPVGPFTFVPLVSPMCRGTQTFVAHPEVATAMRALTVSLLESTGDIDKGASARLGDAVTELASVQLGRTLHALGRGLPIYDVHFGHEGRACVRVEAAGFVP